VDGVRVNKYDYFLGKRVEARYRTGHIYYTATGILAIDNGSSIFVEDHFSQDGRPKTIRVEIPYECVLAIVELKPDPPPRH
jgi:hypothetical protein